jgi:flagellar motor switch/type III secretory pathway protein FliN
MTSATDSPGAAGATAKPPTADDEAKARKRAESQERAALMAQLSADVKMAVARKELTLADALSQAGIPIPEWLRTGASAPAGAPVAPGEVEISATGRDPNSEDQPDDLAAQKAEAVAEEGAAVQPARPLSSADAAPADLDPKEAKRVESQRRLALMQRLPSDVKLRVAKREITLEDALREAGVDPEASV